jgi:PHD/YefM family antitoxin component YafN of YafNO toxin-antitoxin module
MTQTSTREDKTMTRQLTVSEAAIAYGTAVADLQHPIILQQEGQPLAVIVAFEEYQHLRALAADETQRRQAGWRALETLLADVHQRPSDYTPEQIEAEIGAARAEVRKGHGRRRGR